MRKEREKEKKHKKKKKHFLRCRLKKNTDHFTPQCIIKLWKIPQTPEYRRMNEREMFIDEHRKKDEPTPIMLQMAVEQTKKHQEIEFGEHQERLGIPLTAGQWETINAIRARVRAEVELTGN
jgi:hypothetical protein